VASGGFEGESIIVSSVGPPLLQQSGCLNCGQFAEGRSIRSMGASWSSSDAFGLNALLWRHQWEDTRNNEYKELVVRYNEEDCRALHVVVDAFHNLLNFA
jgi:hypothetical protein